MPVTTGMKAKTNDNDYLEISDVETSAPVSQPRLINTFKRRKLSSPQVDFNVTERLTNIHEDVLIVQDSLKEVREKIDKMSLSETRDNEQDNSEAKLMLVSNATSVKDVLKYSDHIHVDADDPDVYICRCCVRPGEKLSGSFKYDSTLGDDFRTLSMPREFRNFKAHIVSHLKSKPHNEKRKEFEMSNKEQEKLPI